MQLICNELNRKRASYIIVTDEFFDINRYLRKPVSRTKRVHTVIQTVGTLSLHFVRSGT